MPQGLSIHVGLNFVDAARYNGWSGQLSGCVNDATDMQRIAQSLGYRSSLLTNGQATASAVIGAIGRAAQQLTSGDILLLTYSGHGGQVSDVNGDEPDGQDETWVLYDRMVLDDELSRLWATFAAGVRVFVLSDSCHSGTVLRMMVAQQAAQQEASNDIGPVDTAPALEPVAARAYGPAAEGGVQAVRQARRFDAVVREDAALPAVKFIPPHIASAVQTRDADVYSAIQYLAAESRDTVRACVVLISGCQDNQVSLDGSQNGLFTEKLLNAWNNGAFSGDYRTFHRAILNQMPSTQTPNLDAFGPGVDAFLRQRPFSINAASTSPTAAVTPPAVIQGPACVTRGGRAPVFRVNPGPGRYYAVEVATQAALFNSQLAQGQRTAENFFASWQVEALYAAASYPTDYTLPDEVWARLGASATKLYYRLWASDARSAWTNYATSTPDADAALAPFVAVQGAGAGAGGAAPAGGTATVPSIQAPSSISVEAGTLRFQVNPGPNRYYAVEVATRPDLLNSNNDAQRTTYNFFGSWKTVPFPRAAVYPASYELPADAWQRLSSQASTLYYRLWATDAPNAWVNPVTTAPNPEQTAPSIEVIDDTPRQADVDFGGGDRAEDRELAGTAGTGSSKGY